MSDEAFSDEALEANRSGRLSVEQQRELEVGLRARHTGVAGFVGRRLDTRVKDVHAGAVQSIEGAISKRSYVEPSGAGLSGPLFFLDVGNRSDGNQRFRSIGELWDFAPEAGFVRLYFLPRSRWAVNLERIAAPPPDASAAGLEQAAASFTRARKAGDKVGQAEAAAEVQAIHEAATGRPPGAAVTGEPLERVILGRWRSPLMRLGLDLREDRTLSAELPDGSKHEGRWSLHQSRLSADIPGSPVEAEAAVVGEQLILTVDGQSLPFERAG